MNKLLEKQCTCTIVLQFALVELTQQVEVLLLSLIRKQQNIHLGNNNMQSTSVQHNESREIMSVLPVVGMATAFFLFQQKKVTQEFSRSVVDERRLLQSFSWS